MNFYDEAAADYEEAISKNVDDPQVNFDLAGALSALGRREDAIMALREVIRLRPDAANPACAISWELERLGRYDEALKILIQHTEHEPNYSRTIDRHLGRIYGRQGRLKEAFASYLRCIWFNPPSATESDHIMKKRFEEMLALRSRAEEMDPEDPRSFRRLGTDLHDANWDDDAVNVLDTAALLKPSVHLYLRIGGIHEGYLRLTEAIDAYLECREKLAGTLSAKEMIPVYDALVTDLSKCGRTKEILKYGAEAVSDGAAGPETLQYYGLALNDPDHQISDWEFMVHGWTAPYYANSSMDLPL